ncbi:hydroxyacid dehydrogenase [Tumebacillus avium]|uniref:Hydroxyacid dehydrogenase n=1 Tax=Tumebacillus avium TaxID=1903704 RepID=A0A1Y0IK46_9BACL|nr:D-2-hydroxyacid dehydrogenase family protein [Tumebacillus avium]ARU60847.1 hydroxyacid dehydrogenase [Tumebacillus avium]
MKTVILDDWEHASESGAVELERLRAFSEVAVYHDQPTPDVLKERLCDADAVILMRERTSLTAELLDSMKNIKLIAQTGTGLAHVDLAEVNLRKIPLATTPGGSTAAVTELTFAFLLALSRDLPRLHQQVQGGAWPVSIGRNLAGKTLGIIGLGKIGQRVAGVAKAFGMNVIAWGPRLTQERADAQGVGYAATLEELLKQSQFVTLHVRLVPETKRLLRAEHFAIMRQDAYLINTSRGELLDETALVTALQNGQIAGAGLDVLTQEPPDPNHPLLQLENVILSPHIGWKTDNTFESFLNGSIENIASFFQKGAPQNIANPEVL